MATRHYLHGDQVDGQSAVYFCAACDSLVPAEHFQSDHPGMDHCERFIVALDRWSRLPGTTRTGRHRPDTAVNLFHEAALVERAKREAARSDFHRWLERQRQRDDVVGDLAKDMMADEKFPAAIESSAELKRYLQGYGEHAVEAGRVAWRRFTASQRYKKNS